MPAVRVHPITNFSGGLNLRDDPFQLRSDESDSFENVDLLPQGGVQRRKTVATHNTSALGSAPLGLWSYISPVVSHSVAQVGQHLVYAGATGAYSTLVLSGTSAKMRAATAGSIATGTSFPTASVRHKPCGYIVRGGAQNSLRYEAHTSTTPTATALTDAATAWNETIGTPVGGRFPQADYIATHENFMFVASTTEDSVAYPNRVRWSHVGQPEDWRSLDYQDVGPGEDGDTIVGMASVGHELLIFKRRSIWSLTASSPGVFSLRRKTDEMGAVSQEAIAVAGDGCAFFDRRRGIMLYAGGEFRWIFDKLATILSDGSIPITQFSKICVGWLKNRLFVSVPWGSSTTNARTFVFDPLVGGWTAYTYGANFFVEIPDNDVALRSLACSPSTGYIWSIDDGTASGDKFAGPVTTTTVTSFFKTGWHDAAMPAVKKRWRRPQFIFDNNDTTTLNIESRKDYDNFASPRYFSVSANSSYDAGSVLTWGSSSWGSSTWGAQPEDSEAMESSVRGPGVAEAVQLRVKGPDSHHWGVNAIHMKYIPMRVRG